MSTVKEEIFHVVVLRKDTILLEYNAKSDTEEINRIIRNLIANLPPQNNQFIYTFNAYNFYVVNEENICYLCVSTKDFRKSVAIAFLHQLISRITERYQRRLYTCGEYGIDIDFRANLLELLSEFNESKTKNKFDNVKNELSDAKQLMVKNIEQVMQRGENIESLVDKSSLLEHRSVRFSNAGRALRRQMCCKKYVSRLILFFVFILILYVILTVLCGGPLLKQCF